MLLALEALEAAGAAPWRLYVAGWLMDTYIPRLNANRIRGEAVKKHGWKAVFEGGPDAANSTCECVVPKSGSYVSDKDGYVQFNIPGFWRELAKGANLEKRHSLKQKKIAAHRLLLLAAEDVEIPQPGDQGSHLCGNPWCALHVTWESASNNQARGQCFNPVTDTIPCGHEQAFGIACVRTKSSPKWDGTAWQEGGMDDRTSTQNPFVRRWMAAKNTPEGLVATNAYKQATNVGGGKRAIQKWMEWFSTVGRKRLLKQQYVAKYNELHQLLKTDPQRFAESVKKRSPT